MKRLLIAIAVTSLPFAACAQNQATAPPPPTNTLPANVANVMQNVVQNSVSPRGAYDVPQQRVNPPGDARPGDARNRPQRGGEWQRRQAAMEQDVRDSMSASGFTDPALQNAILEHIKSESRARAPLRERGRRLYRGLNSPKVNDAEMSLALGAYVTALDADRARRILAESDLDAKIGWSKNPRLHSMLLLFGVIGESPITLPLRSFNQPPKAIPRPEDKRPDAPPPAQPEPRVQPEAPAAPQPPAEAEPPAETPPPVTVLPLDDPPVTDAVEDEN